MKNLPQPPGIRVLCPDECRYRNKIVPVCGFCLPEIMKKLEMNADRKEKNDGREEENSDPNRPG